jgi:hypothetical protein
MFVIFHPRSGSNLADSSLVVYVTGEKAYNLHTEFLISLSQVKSFEMCIS